MVGLSVQYSRLSEFGARLKILQVRSIDNESERNESLSYIFRHWSVLQGSTKTFRISQYLVEEIQFETGHFRNIDLNLGRHWKSYCSICPTNLYPHHYRAYGSTEPTVDVHADGWTDMSAMLLGHLLHWWPKNRPICAPFPEEGAIATSSTTKQLDKNSSNINFSAIGPVVSDKILTKMTDLVIDRPSIF